ncbi:MAG: ABC transporter ATP-binding protein [bacterium]
MINLEFEQVSKSFGVVKVVSDFSLHVEPGELFFLLGPSGCGKTTCLRIVAGFVRADAGRILFGGRDATDLPPHRRNAGMVFQNYALFPHMTVRQNIDYGLRFRSLPQAERRSRAETVMEAVQIAELAGRYPGQLSGGQQQRVALARALIIQPDILLLDEPLSNLDARLRVELRDEIRRLHRLFRTTTLYVTHDQEEALSLADRIAVINSGSIEQVGAPQDIYHHPANTFTARFIGETNLIRGTIKSVDSHNAALISTGCGDAAAKLRQPLPIGNSVFLSIRPQHVHIAQMNSRQTANPPFSIFSWRMRVDSASFTGSMMHLKLKAQNGDLWNAYITDSTVPAAGEELLVSFSPDDAVVLEK